MTINVTIPLTLEQIREIAAEVAKIHNRPRSVSQAAEELGFSECTVRRKIKDKLIPTLPGKPVKIPASYFNSL